ncbi:MAG: hypothetical protein JXA96_08920 [Sedimentisphaerales bacterium]|nr:hypothetical protein [Sedimentisphaerales bacterium]
MLKNNANLIYVLVLGLFVSVLFNVKFMLSRQNDIVAEEISIMDKELDEIQEIEEPQVVPNIDTESGMGHMIGLPDHEIYRLTQLGFENPQEELIADLKKNASQIIPFDGVLGGTMGFYWSEEIYFFNNRWVVAYFEDGHIGGYILLKYNVNDSGEITWSVLQSELG